MWQMKQAHSWKTFTQPPATCCTQRAEWRTWVASTYSVRIHKLIATTSHKQRNSLNTARTSETFHCDEHADWRQHLVVELRSRVSAAPCCWDRCCAILGGNVEQNAPSKWH